MLLASSFLGFSAQRPAAAGSWVPVSNISRVDGVLAGVTAISADLALVAGAANGGGATGTEGCGRAACGRAACATGGLGAICCGCSTAAPGAWRAAG